MRKEKRYNKFIFNVLLCFCVILFTSLSSLAASNSLAGIDVKQNALNHYNVILKISGKANVKKIINSSDNITLTLNSTIPSDSMEIIYDNTSNLNNVIVQKKSADSTIIVLEGNNIANSVIYTKDISSGEINSIQTENKFPISNKNFIIFSIVAIFMYMLKIFGHKQHHKMKSYTKINNSLKTSTKINAMKSGKNLNFGTTPSISYGTSKSYVSAPKDFIINRYMKEEKIRKAG